MPTHSESYKVDKRECSASVVAVVEWLASVPGAVVVVGSIPARVIAFFLFFFNFLGLLLLLRSLCVRHKALLYFRRVSHGFSPLYVRHKAPLYFRRVSHGFSPLYVRHKAPLYFRRVSHGFALL